MSWESESSLRYIEFLGRKKEIIMAHESTESRHNEYKVEASKHFYKAIPSVVKSLMTWEHPQFLTEIWRK
jgi:hypothetical protein